MQLRHGELVYWRQPDKTIAAYTRAPHVRRARIALISSLTSRLRVVAWRDTRVAFASAAGAHPRRGSRHKHDLR